jgi:PAS domain-containing protein
MYLFTRAELIGQSPATVAAPDRNDLDKIQKEMQKVSDTGIPARFDFWAVRKNGEIFPKDVIVNRGKYFGQDVLIAAARDMTEVKKAEQALRESEHFLSEAQRISKIGVINWTSYRRMDFSVELDDYVGLSAADSHTLQDWVSYTS